MTYRSALIPFFLFNGFDIVETEEGRVDNIPTTVKITIETDHLQKQDSILTRKVVIPSIFNTFNIIIIERYLYRKYPSNFYDDRHMDLCILEFIYLNSVLMNWSILPWSLSGQLIYMKLLIIKIIKKITIRKNESIITFIGTTGQIVLNKTFLLFYFSGCFEFHGQGFSKKK